MSEPFKVEDAFDFCCSLRMMRLTEGSGLEGSLTLKALSSQVDKEQWYSVLVLTDN